MLKRKLVRAGLFGNGLVIVIVSVYSINYRQPVKATATLSIDPIIRQLETFDSSFIELSGMPSNVLTDVPKIHLNARMIKYVKDYNNRNLEALEKVKERSALCFPLMDSIFNRYHLPVELKYLAAIESELKTKAVSHVGAVGPWQLMTSTAHDLSLKIKGNYDERTNYGKSTVAAAKYLRDLYHQFGDWLLVVAAYNSGPGKVLAAIKQSGSHNFWVLQNYLPAETKGHVKRFIATHYYFEDYGSVVTLTKAETISYRNEVSKFIASQKTERPKGEVLASVTKSSRTDPELSERN
ncbi:MAG TPA: lytic transglycosylase domain-containing protein [Chitinophagaceae bacterium]|nr:lytic transglycosylase domain-containing protein [Chitinophagaceae bacterium]